MEDFFASFRVCKLTKLIYRHIGSKANGIFLCASNKTGDIDSNISFNRDISEQEEHKLQQMLKTGSCSMNVYYALATVYKQKKQYDKAYTVLHDAIVKGYECYAIYRELGLVCRWLGRYDEAESWYLKGLSCDPKQGYGYVELGWLYREHGKGEEAEKMFRRAIEARSDCDLGYVELGKDYCEQGRYDEAVSMFEKVIGVNPDSEIGYFQLAALYRRCQKYGLAEKVLKQGIKMNPGSVRLCALLSLIYEHQGEYSLVEEYNRKVVNMLCAGYPPWTRQNYQKIKKIVLEYGAQLVCVQYPMRSIVPLKRMLEPCEGIIFVDDEEVFKTAVRESSYDEYFIDAFGGDFGHCTYKGNRLLAENIARVLITKFFKR